MTASAAAPPARVTTRTTPLTDPSWSGATTAAVTRSARTASERRIDGPLTLKLVHEHPVKVMIDAVGAGTRAQPPVLERSLQLRRDRKRDVAERRPVALPGQRVFARVVQLVVSVTCDES